MHPARRAVVRRFSKFENPKGRDPSPLRLVDETNFTEDHLPDRERQLVPLIPTVSMPVFPGNRDSRKHDDRRAERLAYQNKLPRGKLAIQDRGRIAAVFW